MTASPEMWEAVKAGLLFAIAAIGVLNRRSHKVLRKEVNGRVDELVETKTQLARREGYRKGVSDQACDLCPGRWPAVPEILVVEDNENDLRLLLYEAEQLGCKVHAARNLEEAMTLLRKRISDNQRYPFDAVFVDLRLGPGPNGIEVFETLSRIAPMVPVLFTTGFPEDQALVTNSSTRRIEVLRKPVTANDLENFFLTHRIPYQRRA